MDISVLLYADWDIFKDWIANRWFNCWTREQPMKWRQMFSIYLTLVYLTTVYLNKVALGAQLLPLLKLEQWNFIKLENSWLDLLIGLEVEWAPSDITGG